MTSRSFKYRKFLPFTITVALFCTIHTFISGCSDVDSENNTVEETTPSPVPINIKKRLMEQIKVGNEQLAKWKSRRDEYLKPIKEKYDEEYKNYYQQLNSELAYLQINDHEQLMRDCQNHLKICNLLERAEIAKKLITLTDNELYQVDTQIQKLEQNIWKMEKKIEISEISSSPEKEEIDKLIAYTGVIIKEQIKPPEAQDAGKIQKEIFEEIIRNRTTPTVTPTASPDVTPESTSTDIGW